MKALRIPLRAVLYKEDNRWIAHCLEFDLIGDGDTIKDALTCLSQAIEIQLEVTIKHKSPENLFQPAPGKYLRMFAAGKHVAVGELQVMFTHAAQADGVEIEGVDAREYSEPIDAEADLVPA